MKFLPKMFLLVAGLSTALAAQAATLHADLFQPRGAKVVQSKAKSGGEYEAKLRLGKGNVYQLANQAMKHAKSKGYRLVERDITRRDADLKFRKRHRELDINIELNRNGTIEIDQDLEISR